MYVWILSKEYFRLSWREALACDLPGDNTWCAAGSDSYFVEQRGNPLDELLDPDIIWCVLAETRGKFRR